MEKLVGTTGMLVPGIIVYAFMQHVRILLDESYRKFRFYSMHNSSRYLQYTVQQQYAIRLVYVHTGIEQQRCLFSVGFTSHRAKPTEFWTINKGHVWHTFCVPVSPGGPLYV